MAPSSSLAPRVAHNALRHAEREHIENLQRRREVFRRGVIVALALSLATLVVSVVWLVGTQLVTKWWIESQGGSVVWDIDQANWRQGGATSVAFTLNRSWQPRFGNGDLSYLHRLHRVVSLNLAENDHVTNKGLGKLRGLDSLTELNLERLNRYRDPQFSRSSISLSDACLVHLLALPRLEDLTLSGNLITDNGLAEIAKIKTLKRLDLEATEITDAGLAYLEDMKSLETVNLGATRATKAGIMRLQVARPDLVIELDTDPAVEENVKESRGLAQ